MFYQQDWLGKQIQLLVRFVARVVFGKDTAEGAKLIEQSADGTDLLYRDIKKLLNEGRICQAENLLFDSIEPGNKNHLAVAIEFYSMLNDLSDEVLEGNSFSRSEIKDGIRAVMEMYGLDFTDEFLS